MQVYADQLKPEGQRFFLHATVPTADTDRMNIVAAHPDMLRWAAEYGDKRVLSMDSTFGLTCYGYSLLTVTVVDHEGRGKPIMWALLSSESADEISIALKHMLHHVRKLNPTWWPASFIIDDSTAECNGIKYVSQGAFCFSVLFDIVNGHSMICK